MKVIGIHDGHNSSVALFDSNRIVYTLSEERLARVKNKGGTPVLALVRLLSDMKLKPSDIDFVAVSGTAAPRPEWVERDLIMNRYREQADIYKGSKFNRLVKLIYKSILTFTNKQDSYKKIEDRRLKKIYNMGFVPSQIKFVDHHQCHAAAALYSGGDLTDNTLILTNDGGGDGLCGTVSVVKNSKIIRIAEIPQHDSFASLYSRATFNMGLVPLEHEYKIMGMAPYGDPERSSLICKKLIDFFEWPDDNKLLWSRSTNKSPTYLWGSKLEEIFRFRRFDDISMAMQDFVEFMTLTWVKNCLKETGAKNLVLGGGLFMNVKLNKLILELDKVEKVFIMPSCSDESNSMGAAYQIVSELMQEKLNILPLKDLYLGAIYNEDDILNTINNFDFGYEVSIEEHNDIEDTIASLISSGEIVARYWGREEFGARALGSRSILSDPRKLENIVEINKMIKQRDFWMPFAGSMRSEDAEKNLYNPKKHNSPFMIITFDTNDGVKNFRAATHPYDLTIRPQVVEKSKNPHYYKILNNFHKITGSNGGLLNTSFNLHGYPIVSSPLDAVNVFHKSGLKFLALDKYLLRKI